MLFPIALIGSNTSSISFHYSNTCLNRVIHFSPNIHSESTPISFHWEFGDASFSNDESPFHAYENAGEYNVLLSILFHDGSQVKHDMKVTIHEFPIAAFQYESSCEENIYLHNQSHSNLPLELKDWQINQFHFKNEDEIYVPSLNEKLVNAKLLVQNKVGCVDSVTHQFHVKSKPKIDYSIDGHCEGQSTKIQFSTKEPTNHFEWKLNDEKQNEWTVTRFLEKGNYTLEAIASNNNGCIDTIHTHFNIFETPNIQITNIPTEACVPLHLNLSPITNSSLANVNWILNEQIIAQNLTFNHAINQAGNYLLSLEAVSTDGCIITMDSVANLLVHEKPIIQTNVASKKLNNNKGYVFISSQTAYPEEYVDWGDGYKEYFTSSVEHLYENSEPYLITTYYKNQFGCLDSSLHFTQFETSFDVEVTQNITPNYDGINDHFVVITEFDHPLKLVIYDNLGREIFFTQNHFDGWNCTDIAPFQSGIYYYQIEDPNYPGAFASGNFLIQK